MFRKPCGAAVPLLALLALLLVALAGCGSGPRLSAFDATRAKPGGGGGGGGTITAPTAPYAGWSVVPLMSFNDAWPGAAPRWKDIGDYLYSAKFRSQFVSNSSGAVYVSHNPDAASGVLETRVYARGLKPNFCYQIKLVGKPGDSATGGGIWGAEADMTGNTNIVKAGRYWDYGTETPHYNTTDRDFVVNDPYFQTGWVAGYLVLGCFVTDVNGDTPGGWVTLNGDDGVVANHGSYHVVWKSGQTILSNYVGPYPYSLVRTGSSLSGSPYPARTSGAQVSLYLEPEPGVAQPYALPSGSYDTVLMMTEESFHASGLGGTWLTVRVSDWSTISSPVSGVPWVGKRGTPVQFLVP